MRRRAVLGLPLALAACGFAPAYGPGGAGAALRGRIAVVAPETPDGARLRAALEDRLGPGGPLRLEVAVTVGSTGEGRIAGEGDARRRLEGVATWRLAGEAGALASGRETASALAVALGPAASVMAAEADARVRLAAMLADRIVARLLARESLR